MVVAVLFAGYLLGAIPFAYLVVRFTQGTDIRKVGSGNVGATNALRAAGRGWGLATLVLDGAKGFAAVELGRYLTGSPDWGVAAGVAAVLGHIFPVFLRFRGGKGVSTGAGVFLAAAPAAVGVSALGFVAALALSRYVSLGSIMAAACFPAAAWALGQSPGVILGGGCCSLMIVLKHWGNIQRIAAGTERRLELAPK